MSKKSSSSHQNEQHEGVVYFFYFIIFFLLLLYGVLQFPSIYYFIKKDHDVLAKIFFKFGKFSYKLNPFKLLGLQLLLIICLYWIKPHKKLTNKYLIQFSWLIGLVCISLPFLCVYPIRYFNSASYLYLILYAISLFMPVFGVEVIFNIFDLSSGKVSPIFKRFGMNKSFFENKYSIHWNIYPKYKLNLLNPFRGITIVGGPGSGKSYSVIEEIIDQLIHKNFAALIYDFKFPTLSEYAYAAWFDAKEKKETTAVFNVIYFKDVRYSDRCNPLHHTVLTEYAMANEASTTILLNINKTWAAKQGEFFSDSAIIILTAVIWYLRCKSIEDGKDYSSLPHAIEFASHPDFFKIIDILTEHPEVKNTIVALQSAKRSEAMEQLGGQMGSLQIALSKLNDKKMLWVMSGNDFDLEINVPGKERILILGNDDRFKKTYAPALSLYASMCAGMINQKKRTPCGFIIDEFPTIFLNNFEQLPATARSNKVACIIAMQDFAQLRDAYGKEKADIIVSTLGNVFVGETAEKNTAHYASELVGKGIVKRRSYGADDNANVNISEQYDLLIYPHEIQKLNQGEFVGKICEVPEKDTSTLFSGSNNETEKTFAGKIMVEKPKRYYDDKGEFINKLPKRAPFNNLKFASEEDELIEVDRIITANIEKIRLEVNDLILTEFYGLQFYRYLEFTSEQGVKDAISVEVNQAETSKEKTVKLFILPYVRIAIEEENAIYSDPAKKKMRASATHHAFLKATAKMVEDYPTSQNSDDHNGMPDLPADFMQYDD